MHWKKEFLFFSNILKNMNLTVSCLQSPEDLKPFSNCLTSDSTNTIYRIRTSGFYFLFFRLPDTQPASYISIGPYVVSSVFAEKETAPQTFLWDSRTHRRKRPLHHCKYLWRIALGNPRQFFFSEYRNPCRSRTESHYGKSGHGAPKRNSAEHTAHGRILRLRERTAEAGQPGAMECHRNLSEPFLCPQEKLFCFPLGKHSGMEESPEHYVKHFTAQSCRICRRTSDSYWTPFLPYAGKNCEAVPSH